MKKLKFLNIFTLALAVLVSATLAACVPMLIFGFRHASAVLVLVGSLFLIHGLYGIFFYWVWFRNVHRRYLVARCVAEENMFSAAEIAARLKKSRDGVNRDIRYCIRKKYLTGLTFNGNVISPVRQEG